MVRSVLALSMLMSLLVLAALWSMEDPQPWLPDSPEATEPTRSPTPEVSGAPRSERIAPPLMPPEIPCVGAKLLGTLVGQTGEVSFAALDMGDRVITAALGEGLQCGVISGIEPDRVLLRGKGGERVVLVREQENPAGQARTAAGAVPTIRHHGSGLYELSRAEVERLLLEPSAELLSTRVLPEVKEGQVTGYRVQFADNSPLGGLGLRSGDVVQAVNGIALNSPASTLDAYQRMREGGGGELELLRGGQPVRVRYVLR